MGYASVGDFGGYNFTPPQGSEDDTAKKGGWQQLLGKAVSSLGNKGGGQAVEPTPVAGAGGVIVPQVQQPKKDSSGFMSLIGSLLAFL